MLVRVFGPCAAGLYVRNLCDHQGVFDQGVFVSVSIAVVCWPRLVFA